MNNPYQLTGPFIGTIVFALVLTLMWRAYREPYLGLWAIAAVLWMVRYIYAFVGGHTYLLPNEVALPLIGVLRGTFILWGGFSSRGLPMPRAWWFVVGADLALLAVEWRIGTIPIFGVQALTHYALLSVSVGWSGLLFLSDRRNRGPESATVGISLCVIALLHASFPFSAALGTNVALVFTITLNVAMLAAGFGILMYYFRRVNRERDALLEQLKGALAKALSGYLPICAFCKSIRDENGAWVRLEKYISHRTDVAFSHGVCSTCMQQHYAEFADGADAPASRAHSANETELGGGR